MDRPNFPLNGLRAFEAAHPDVALRIFTHNNPPPAEPPRTWDAGHPMHPDRHGNGQQPADGTVQIPEP